MPRYRQVLMYSLPPLAFGLLGIYWYKRKRAKPPSTLDTDIVELYQTEMASVKGERDNAGVDVEMMEHIVTELLSSRNTQQNNCSIEERVPKSDPIDIATSYNSSQSEGSRIPKSAPINIISNGYNNAHCSPHRLSDDEIDIEIEKIIKKESVVKRNLELNGCALNKSNLSNQVEDSQPISVECTARCTAEELHNTSLQRTEEGFISTDACSSNENNCSTQSSTNDAPSVVSPERDSANHSPVDTMLASPNSHYSDNHSELSSDSGKGGSAAASPPLLAARGGGAGAGGGVHQFVVPQLLVGLLIGKNGSFVSHVRANTGASIFVKRHPDSIKVKICSIEGSQSEIEAALDLIKKKFPEKRFPHLSLEDVSAELSMKAMSIRPEILQIHLVEGVNNDILVTCLISAGHFFLQQPTHPTFPSLHVLHKVMAASYQNPDAPSVPSPLMVGTICVAPTENNWYRAQVLSAGADGSTLLKLVDFGGFLSIDASQLKQIRADFMVLPFQATEAVLANVKPVSGEWSSEALDVMAGLTAGHLVQAQVVGYDEAGMPLVHLYLAIGPQQVVFLNQELVDRSLAQWEVSQDL